jgi:hypothetical protein
MYVKIDIKIFDEIDYFNLPNEDRLRAYPKSVMTYCIFIIAIKPEKILDRTV